MNTIISIISILTSFLLMEFASWLMHKYVMHGPLWNIHKTHHQHRKGWLELNDLFTLFFAGLAITLLLEGLAENNAFYIGTGTGISLYGLTYFIVHDLLIHRRFKIFGRAKNPVIMALTEAHRDHHKSKERNESTSFGLLLVHKKYYQKHLRRKGRKS